MQPRGHHTTPHLTTPHTPQHPAPYHLTPPPPPSALCIASYYAVQSNLINTTDSNGNRYEGLHADCAECADEDEGIKTFTSSGSKIDTITSLNCASTGVTLENVPFASGYWRRNDKSKAVFECLNPKACKGGSYNETSSTDGELDSRDFTNFDIDFKYLITLVLGARRKYTATLTAITPTISTHGPSTSLYVDFCSKGHEGPLCAVCSRMVPDPKSDGDHINYYMTSGFVCQPCSGRRGFLKLNRLVVGEHTARLPSAFCCFLLLLVSPARL